MTLVTVRLKEDVVARVVLIEKELLLFFIIKRRVNLLFTNSYLKFEVFLGYIPRNGINGFKRKTF